MPVQAKTEQAFIKRAFLLQILDDETGVKDARADLMRGGGEEMFAGKLNKGQRMAFGVFEGEARRPGFVFGHGTGLDLMGDEKFAHRGDAWSCESNFGKEIVGCTSGDLLELNALVAVDGVAGIGDAEASCSGGVEAEDFGVEGAGGVKVGGEETDGSDAGNFGAWKGLCFDDRDFLNAEYAESIENRNANAEAQRTPTSAKDLGEGRVHGLGWAAVNSEQQGFSLGVNSMNSTRV